MRGLLVFLSKQNGMRGRCESRDFSLQLVYLLCINVLVFFFFFLLCKHDSFTSKLSKTLVVILPEESCHVE